MQANAIQGPIHLTLGIAMDMSIQLKAANGAICTLSLHSTTTARWALSSATSATLAPTSPATMISSTAKKKRSTSARSMFR